MDNEHLNEIAELARCVFGFRKNARTTIYKFAGKKIKLYYNGTQIDYEYKRKQKSPRYDVLIIDFCSPNFLLQLGRLERIASLRNSRLMFNQHILTKIYKMGKWNLIPIKDKDRWLDIIEDTIALERVNEQPTIEDFIKKIV